MTDHVITPEHVKALAENAGAHVLAPMPGRAGLRVMPLRSRWYPGAPYVLATSDQVADLAMEYGSYHPSAWDDNGELHFRAAEWIATVLQNAGREAGRASALEMEVRGLGRSLA